jgi:deazaflavin-dependent oxidoreductase (nitroreductase family)
MDDAAARALALTPASSSTDRTVEITTIGRRSGLPRRIEIWFYRVGDTNYLSGMPGRDPDWYHNLEEQPRFTFHLKHGVRADLPAAAIPITDQGERRRVFTAIVADLNQPSNPGSIIQPTSVEAWLEGSVLAEIAFD